LRLFCLDDEHSDRQSKRDRHVCVILQSPSSEGLDDDRSVTKQHLRPVRVSLLAEKEAIMVYAGHVDLWNCPHVLESLHCRYLPHTLQDSKNYT